MKKLFLFLTIFFLIANSVTTTKATSLNNTGVPESPYRITFFDNRGDSLVTVEGWCSIENYDVNWLAITCKTSPDTYKRDYFGNVSNSTFFVEPIDLPPYHYKVTYKILVFP